MRHHVAALRHRAFVVKLALRRVAGFYNDMKRAKLATALPTSNTTWSIPR